MRADLLLKLGRIAEAEAALRQAIDWSANQAEKNLLQQRLESVESGVARASFH